LTTENKFEQQAMKPGAMQGESRSQKAVIVILSWFPDFLVNHVLAGWGAARLPMKSADAWRRIVQDQKSPADQSIRRAPAYVHFPVRESFRKPGKRAGRAARIACHQFRLHELIKSDSSPVFVFYRSNGIRNAVTTYSVRN
jgi:hypothetical protein